MNRRGFVLSAAAASLARPAIASPSKVLRFVPQSNLNSIDPVWTTATVTRNFGLMVFETLYGRDGDMNPQPQMLEGALVEDDGKRWTIKLREGLRFHDGEPVLARDCVASLRRWMKRDTIGATIAARSNQFEAADDRTIVLRLTKPFPLLPKVLSKNQTSPVIVPERIAATDPFKQIPEVIGSGPFRFVADEQVIGVRAVFEKFNGYRSRDEKTNFTAGGRQVHLDRVEWQIIPDPGTAANALMTGEIDWIEMPLPDLIPVMRRQPNVVTGRIDPHGLILGLRPNHLNPPTNNVAVRRAMMAAIDQREVMTAVMGEDPEGWRDNVGYLASGKPAVDDIVTEAARARPSRDAIKAMLDKTGYRGEPVVLLHATDQSFYNAGASVAAASLRAVGFNIDEQMMDWGTVIQRRTSREPLNRGGWSLFTSSVPAAEYRDPLLANTVRSNGKDAWFGWPDDPVLERIYQSWVDSVDPAEQTRLEQAFQRQALDFVPVIPMGRYMQSAAWSRSLSGIPLGPAPLFWNVTKS